LAFWSGRGSLGSGCGGALESIEKPTLMGDAETSSFALNLETPWLRSFRIKDLAGIFCQIFELKGLSCKLFKNQ
jgi:hypothetical protein